jgi:hypothetical protein
MKYNQYIKLKECAKSNDYESWNNYRVREEGRNINLKYANLSELNLSKFNLSFSDLKFSSFNKSSLEGVILHDAVVGQKSKRDEILYVLLQVFSAIFFPIIIFFMWDTLAITGLDKTLTIIVINSIFITIVYFIIIGLPLKYSIFFAVASFVTLTIYKYAPQQVLSFFNSSDLPDSINFLILIIISTLTLFTLVTITETTTNGFFYFLNLGTLYAIVSGKI